MLVSSPQDQNFILKNSAIDLSLEAEDEKYPEKHGNDFFPYEIDTIRLKLNHPEKKADPSSRNLNNLETMARRLTSIFQRDLTSGRDSDSVKLLENPNEKKMISQITSIIDPNQHAQSCRINKIYEALDFKLRFLLAQIDPITLVNHRSLDIKNTKDCT